MQVDASQVLQCGPLAIKRDGDSLVAQSDGMRAAVRFEGAVVEVCPLRGLLQLVPRAHLADFGDRWSPRLRGPYDDNDSWRLFARLKPFLHENQVAHRELEAEESLVVKALWNTRIDGTKRVEWGPLTVNRTEGHVVARTDRAEIVIEVGEGTILDRDVLLGMFTLMPRLFVGTTSDDDPLRTNPSLGQRPGSSGSLEFAQSLESLLSDLKLDRAVVLQVLFKVPREDDAGIA